MFKNTDNTPLKLIIDVPDLGDGFPRQVPLTKAEAKELDRMATEILAYHTEHRAAFARFLSPEGTIVDWLRSNDMARLDFQTRIQMKAFIRKIELGE